MCVCIFFPHIFIAYGVWEGLVFSFMVCKACMKGGDNSFSSYATFRLSLSIEHNNAVQLTWQCADRWFSTLTLWVVLCESLMVTWPSTLNNAATKVLGKRLSSVKTGVNEHQGCRTRSYNCGQGRDAGLLLSWAHSFILSPLPFYLAYKPWQAQIAQLAPLLLRYTLLTFY